VAGRKPMQGLHQQLGPVRLSCSCLAYYPGVRPRAGDSVLCHKHDRWALADVLYPSSPGCGSQGRDQLDPAFILHCTQSRGHAGDHHDEVAGQKFPAAGRLRSVVEGNTGRRP
jgi:hypothetical protein